MTRKNLLDWPARKLLPLLDGADRAAGKAFDRPDMLRPHTRSRFYGWTHYGVMIPDLPAPHRFFSIMSIIGTPGAQAFDMDHVRKASPRRNATVVSGTAASHPQHFGSYAIDRDCQMADDGSLIRFGKDVEISGNYPEYRVQARYGEFAIDIWISNTDKVSWFVKNPIYEHFSLLSRYFGEITWQGATQAVSGLCTFEYGACISPYNLRDRPLPPALKVPLDFFCYNIINLDEHSQLLFSLASVKGVSVMRSAFIRTLSRHSVTWHDVELDITRYRDEVAVSPDGIRMRLPDTFVWRVREQGDLLLEVRAQSDTPFTYGLGNGYVGGFAYEGEHQGRRIGGRGYIEFIDLQ